MAEVYTTGWWKPFPGQEEAFVDAWTEFASWAERAAGRRNGTTHPRSP